MCRNIRVVWNIKLFFTSKFKKSEIIFWKWVAIFQDPAETLAYTINQNSNKGFQNLGNDFFNRSSLMGKGLLCRAQTSSDKVALVLC